MKVKPADKVGAVTVELDRSDEPLLEAASRLEVASAFKIKRILVPIDFSDCSKKALQYALPLAKEHEAALTLLYVVPISYRAGEFARFDYAHWVATLAEEGAKELGEVLLNVVRGAVPAQPLVRVGSPAPEIIDTAESLAADLIVIATHGRTGLKHVCLGSVAEHVIQRAPCPVLVVRNTAD